MQGTREDVMLTYGKETVVFTLFCLLWAAQQTDSLRKQPIDNESSGEVAQVQLYVNVKV